MKDCPLFQSINDPPMLVQYIQGGVNGYAVHGIEIGLLCNIAD
jgi:hypothetical protein